MITVELIVNMDCQGCERKVRKALRNMNGIIRMHMPLLYGPVHALAYKGVESIDIDMNLQKVTVSGWIDQEKVLRKVRRTGKKAELWPFPNNPEMIGFEYTQEYADMYTYHSDPTTYFQQPPADHNSTYNYYDHSHEHGSNGQYYQQQHVTYDQQLAYSTGIGERVTIAFSDENVNACSIM